MKMSRIIFLVFCCLGIGSAFPEEGHSTPASLHCKKAANTFFEERWGNGMVPGGETATVATYTHHANEKLGQCVILIDAKTSNVKKKSTSNHSLILYDLSDGKEYGTYEEEKSAKRLGKSLVKVTCKVNDSPCGSESEFQAMIRSYMEE